jgi:hypothetical protein
VSAPADLETRQQNVTARPSAHSVESIGITVREAASRGLRRHAAPLTWGLPMPRGTVHSTAAWALRDPDGRPLPLQTSVLSRWPDGSVRWVLLDSQVHTDASGAAGFSVITAGGRGSIDTPSLAAQPSADGTIAVDTGAARFLLSPNAPLGLASVRVKDGEVIEPDACGVRLSIAQGSCRIRWSAVTTEENGPLRTSVRMNGEARLHGRLIFQLIARWHFFRGLPVARLRLTIRNPRPAKHPGGCWELGDAGSRLIEELAVVLRRSAAWTPDRIEYSVDPDQPLAQAREQVTIYQESSGGHAWQSPNHVNRHGLVPHRLKGYQVTSDGQVTHGHRATPLVAVRGGDMQLAVSVPAFWENFPRTLTADGQGVTIGFFPPEYPDLHELQGGEQKTHEAWLAFGRDPVTEIPLDWCRSTLVAAAPPAWYAASGVVPYLTPEVGDRDTGYAALVRSAIEGPERFTAKREHIDEFGWRHFGDIYADHEAVRHDGPDPFISHYNNQYDAIAGFACQFMRTTDSRWWTLCLALAAHVVDIDTYHTDGDKSAYNHGLFWHTVHYVEAGRATHRSYPRTEGSNGGGPSAEHNYTTGLLLHHFLTGDPLTRDAALELAQFVIDMDDGRLSRFRYFDRGDTGLATASGGPLYHGPGRAGGNSLNALLDGHLLSGERRFLDKAEALIRRAVHPRQALEPLNLLDRESRWFYTTFLEALARYLDYKRTLGEIDAMSAYGRAALLHYARWMADHEYPYLERPEELEFPTETWAAQDMRKSDIFGWAALHASGAERERFVEQSARYFQYCTTTLAAMPTRHLTRPVVLLLTRGYPHMWLERHAHEVTAEPIALPYEGDDRPSPPFVPQKVRALRRAKAALAVTGLMAAGALVLALLAVW